MFVEAPRTAGRWIAPLVLVASVAAAAADLRLVDAVKNRDRAAARALLAQKVDVKGFAHITGGGLTDNIPRVLPDGMEVVLQRRSWARDPVFEWLASTGRIAAAEMYRTFNCGIGMVAVVAPAEVDAALASLRASGETAAVIGTVTRGSRGVVIEE